MRMLPQQPDQSAPDSGGPAGDNGAIAIPKKAEKPDVPPPPPEPKVKNPQGLQNFSLRVDVPEVTLNVGVILQKTHEFVPNLQPANFRVYEDGVPQKVVNFQRTKAPITAVLLCEFASTNWYFVHDMREAAYAFAQQLQPDDYIAVVTYDLKTQILTDFTQDKRQVYESLNTLTIPGFSETDMFDAVYSTLDRLSRIEGRKYVVLIASGYDSFSKINLDKVLAKIKATPNVTIFSIGTGQVARLTGNARTGMFGPKEIDYLQADNQMSTFARMTGGMSFFPRFQGEMPDIFHSINDSIRNQYVLTYTPTQRQAGRDLSEDPGGAGGQRRPAAQDAGRKAPPDEVRRHCAGWLQGQAAGGLRGNCDSLCRIGGLGANESTNGTSLAVPY